MLLLRDIVSENREDLELSRISIDQKATSGNPGYRLDIFTLGTQGVNKVSWIREDLFQYLKCALSNEQASWNKEDTMRMG